MKKEIKHNCGSQQVWDAKKGKCVNPNTEVKEYSENPNSRSRASPNLTFPTSNRRKR